MEDTTTGAMLDLAKSLAREAASISLPAIGRVKSQRKADNSVVTETDYAIQERILSVVAATYPDHAVVAEETAGCHCSSAGPHGHRFETGATFPDPRSARYCWVVDPLDGTRNYAAGFPCFATSIAVLDRGVPVVAVVAEHNLGLVHSAAAGCGAFRECVGPPSLPGVGDGRENETGYPGDPSPTLREGAGPASGQPIRVVEPAAGGDFLVGIPSSKDEMTVRILRRWVATRGFVCRNTGSTALHLALVASGALAGAFARQAKIWDVAAGALLVVEAGGRFTDPAGRDLTPFALDGDPNDDLPVIAGPPDLHRKLLESIEAADPGGDSVGGET